MTQKSNHHLLAPEIKRMILKWVNDDRDPEEMVLHRDVARSIARQAGGNFLLHAFDEATSNTGI